MQRNKLWDCQTIHTLLADKLAVREFVASRVDPHVLTRLYWHGIDLSAAPKNSVPKKFVIKANHACDANFFVENRDVCDWRKAPETCQAWLHMDYSESWAEWQYR